MCTVTTVVSGTNPRVISVSWRPDRAMVDSRAARAAPLLTPTERARTDSSSSTASTKSRHGLLRVFLTVSVVSLGSSFQFGFGTGILNNLEAIVPASLAADGHPITLLQWSLVVSGFAVGGLLGSLLAVVYAGEFGRKTVLLANNVVVVASSALLMLGTQWHVLLLGRVLSGMVAGMATGIVPLYFAEIAPARVRGAVGVAHQLGVTLGIVASQALTTPSFGLLGTEELWRYAFLVPVACALLECVVLPFCPESPSFLYRTSGAPAAVKTLAELHANPEVSLQLQQLHHDERLSPYDANSFTVAELLVAPSLRRQLLVGVGLLLSMQLCGIDALFYYSTSVLRAGGLADPQRATTTLSLANVATSTLAIGLIDKAGRKTLLRGAWGAMALAYALAAAGLLDGNQDELVVMAMIGVLAAFALGPGCVAWFVIAEIFPPYARDAAMTVGVALNWIANAFIALVFPSIHEALGASTLLLFALLAAAFGSLTHRYVPETKGKSVVNVVQSFESLSFP